MKRLFLIVLSIFLGVLFLGDFKIQADTQKGCVTDKCHSNIVKFSYTHDPVKNGDCSFCHEAKDSDIKKHISKPASFKAFKAPEGVTNVCVQCHDKPFEGKYVHEPVKNGDCSSCHNPHGGEHKSFLVSELESDTCYQCHDSSKMKKEYQHGPVASGECATCHNPHASNYQFQLKNDKKVICYNCHEDRKAGIESKNVVHKPLKDNGCIDCHDPHSSNAPQHLKANSEKELCFNCHKDKNSDIIKFATSAKYPHKPVKDGACGTCHNPHSTDAEKLLKADTSQICYTCHKDMGEKIKKSKFIHEPVKGDACATCHNVHGSDNPTILTKFFPKTFYNKYSDENYLLCFECHESKSLKSPKTTEDTKFRNGDDNLHYLHVTNKENGRSCKACHEVHAGDQDLHIRRSVPYGSSGWNLPIKFTKTENGGRCFVGCHKPKEYNRVSPVKYR